MSAFKVIYRDGNPSWDEGCPVKLEAIQVARNAETGKCYLQTRLRNVSDAKCAAIEFGVCLADGQGETEEVDFRLLDADLPAGETMKPQAKPINLSEVAGAKSVVTRVDDERAFGPKLEVPEPKTLELDESLVKERRSILAGKGVDVELCDKAYLAQSDWWVCGCAALNYRRGTCWKCGAPVEILSDADSADYLAEHAIQRAYDIAVARASSNKRADVTEAIDSLRSLADKGFKDSAKKLTEAQDRLSALNAAAAKRGKKAKVTVAALAAIAIAAFAVDKLVIAPAKFESTYSEAVAAENEGSYEEAIALYKSLGDYKDSASRLAELKENEPNEAIYSIANRKEEDGYFGKAIELFESLGDYKDSADRADKAREELYNKAVSQFNNGKYYTAADLFDELGDYADAARLEQEARALAKHN